MRRLTFYVPTSDGEVEVKQEDSGAVLTITKGKRKLAAIALTWEEFESVRDAMGDIHYERTKDEKPPSIAAPPDRIEAGMPGRLKALSSEKAEGDR